MWEMHEHRQRQEVLRRASGFLPVLKFFGAEAAISALAYLQTDEGKAELEKHGLAVTVQKSVRPDQQV